MTPRGARLVGAVAALAWGAAALAFVAPRLPEGLAAACDPGLVARELAAFLLAVALLLGPALLADEPARSGEDPAPWLACLSGLPPLLALHLAGGGAPADLLPVAALLLAAGLASGAYLRLDPTGRWGTTFAGLGVGLLGGLPIAAWACADLGGWEGAAGAFRFCPLLAARHLEGSWEAVAPALLLLVGISAILRLAPRPAVVVVAILLLGGIPAAEATPEETAQVLLLGDTTRGRATGVAQALHSRGLRSFGADVLPDPLPAPVEVVLVARAPRGDAEAAQWRGALREFLLRGGRAAAAPGPAADLLASAAEPGILGLVVSLPDDGAVAAAADVLALPRAALALPAEVAPELFRLPFPAPARSLPARTLAFLGLLAVAFAGSAFHSLRGGHGPFRSVLSIAAVAATGCGLLFLPGLQAGEFAESRIALEERASGGAVTARRVELLRVERIAAGEGTRAAPGPGWREVRYEDAAPAAVDAAGGIRLAGRGRHALLARVSGADTVPGAAPPVSFEVGPGRTLEEGLARLPSSPRNSLAAAALRALLRPLAGRRLRIDLPASGPLAVVVHGGE